MQPKVSDRIIELARQWQDARRWLSSFTAAEVCRDEDKKAHRARSVYPGEVAGHEQRSTQHRQVVDDRHSELNKLETLLRQHAPKLLTLVPIVNFCESPPADLAPWLNAMREIEAEVLAGRLDANDADTEQTTDNMERLAAVFGDSGGKMLAVIQNDDLSTDMKLRAAERIDKPRITGMNAEQLGKTLGVSGQAVRKTDWWIERKPRFDD